MPSQEISMRTSLPGGTGVKSRSTGTKLASSLHSVEFGEWQAPSKCPSVSQTFQSHSAHLDIVTSCISLRMARYRGDRQFCSEASRSRTCRPSDSSPPSTVHPSDPDRLTQRTRRGADHIFGFISLSQAMMAERTPLPPFSDASKIRLGIAPVLYCPGWSGFSLDIYYGFTRQESGHLTTMAWIP